VDGGSPQALTPNGIRGADVAPDGSSIVTTDSGKYYVFPINGGQPREISGLEQGDAPIRWSEDGHHIFVRRPAPVGPHYRLYRLDVTSGRTEFLREIGPVDPVGAQMINVVMTPDGKSYAYSYQRDVSSLYLAKGLK
jgi:dipeptidyl aminopeptidase/acylaminoacyl peptidase